MTRETRRRKPSSRKLSKNGELIVGELSKRGLTLKGWLEERGFHARYQRAAAEILSGRVTGERCTDPTIGGTTRAIMLAMADDFGIAWDWMRFLTPSELAQYRQLAKKMEFGPEKLTKVPSRRERLRMMFNPHVPDIAKELQEAKERILRTQDDRRRKRRAETLMRGCVYFQRCPVCLEPATYHSEALDRRKADGAVIRTQSVLTCKGGCFGGRGITSDNILCAIIKTVSIGGKVRSTLVA